MIVDVNRIHKYLLEHSRRADVFPGWTDEQVLDIFEKSNLSAGAYTGLAEDGQRILGCAITFPRHDVGYLYVTAFFAEDKNFWPGVMQALFERFPYYHIAGRVAGKFVKFDNAFLRRQFLDLSKN